MNCNEIREQLVDVAAGVEPPVELRSHVETCAGCAKTLKELSATMALLDEWQAPEPSPYFDTRLQARLREERRSESVGWFSWFRKPILAVAATLLVAAGIGLFQGGNSLNNQVNHSSPTPEHRIVATEGSAVSDLQLLDKNSDMLQDFDALDALDGTVNNAPVMN